MNNARLVFALVTSALAAGAHPMGNFSVNHYARLGMSPHGVDITYVLDLAEIPTFEILQRWELDRASPRAELQRRAAAQGREWAQNLLFTADGRPVAAQFRGAELVMAEGAGAAPVMRIVSRLRLPVASGALEFEDRNYAERAGWKEIVVIPERGVSIRRSTQGSHDRSKELTAYPQDPAVAPPQDLKASVEWAIDASSPQPPAPTREPVSGRSHFPPTGSMPIIANRQSPAVSSDFSAPGPQTPVTASTQPEPSAPGTVVRGDFLSRMLHNREIGWDLALLGIAVAFGLGGLHAFSPGHGKTIVAAYLIGNRGTVRHAMILGGVVTFTHTISVFFLGFVTLFLSHYVLPEKISNVLGAISGLSIVWIGAMLLYKRAKRLRTAPHDYHPHHHDHDPAHTHNHDHGHDHSHSHGHSHVPEGDITMGSLIALGASGGLVPCPSALVLLLSSIALGRVGLGIMLLLGFSAGLAVVLMSIGILVLYAKHLLPDSETTSRNPAFRILPVLSAAFIVCVGLIMTGVSFGVIRPDRVLGV